MSRFALRWSSRWARSGARRTALRDGMFAVAPLLPGTVSWGLVTGIALVKAGLTTGQALGMAALVFSGTAQLVTIPLIVAGASLPVVMLTVFLTNLRFIIYSATLARDLGRLPLPLRLGLGYLTSDTALAAYRLRYRDGEPQVQRVALFAGCCIPVYLVWQIGSLAGIGVAHLLPAGAGLGYLGTLAVVAMTAALVRSASSVAAAAVAIGVALLGRGWPYSLGMFGAVVAGIAAAMLVESLQRRRAR
ncbi:MAG: AzlC family ABC transporter permease [Pseudomonadota bacterium]|jgi:predicted branched-subunit amino acid permease|nr:AzlC family ABC transporter permease [Pseudomonadota bacterium]